MKGSAMNAQASSARANSRNSTIRARVYRAAEDKWYDLGIIAQSPVIDVPPAIEPSLWQRFKTWLKGVFGRGAAKPE